ncbi:sirohydrochlorin cobaltochelatase [Fundidesulfovibrio putealis]|uniref:sirohydrochlorin cobaltochelatase n=1 Tax=Fundidesulfovibrio putealis TaxID=270496 RepID=UPI000421E54A|nr:sirohydrochlorin cobaltochelatase [Fundidesulfovibrio putealis]
MPTPETILILAAHGSSHPQARESLEGFAARVRREHPGLDVRMAYTATPRPGNHPGANSNYGLADTLAGLAGKTGLDLRVQSLHVIAGADYDRMREALEAFAAAAGARLTMCAPLLAGPQDAPAAARALAAALGEDEPGEAVVLMGHGTTHDAQDLYRVLAERLKTELPKARLGVLEAADPGDPLSIQAIARDLESCGVRSARLVPLLTVAGRHAHKDLAGDRPGSWKSVLAEHGIAGLPDLAGLLEREVFVRLWLERLRTLLGA